MNEVKGDYMAKVNESDKPSFPMTVYRDGTLASSAKKEHADRFGNARNEICEVVDSYTRRPIDAPANSPASPVKRS
jgi:hypothetical protein